MNTLDDWLAHCERLHPAGIALGLERVQRVAERMQLRLDCPVITVAGTNGKGSTCAMLEAILLEAGYRTGVYTSPHLVRFEERCRVRGESVAAADLLPQFARVEQARAGEALTYFEFTTLAIVATLAEARLDVLVLEVGLGGRLDAVNVFDADCAIVTSVDVDHTDFLGHSREEIGREKAGVLRPGKLAIISDPVPPESLLAQAQALGCDVWRFGHDFNYQGDAHQWSWAGRGRRYAGLAYPALRGVNQLINASGVLAALTALRPQLPVTAQAVRNGLALVQLPGRFQVEAGQPALVLDVAHNPHAVAALAANLEAMGDFMVTHGVFGGMQDKDLDAMLRLMDGLIDRWYFTDLPSPRAASAEQLEARWRALSTRKGAGAGVYASPAEALQAAAERVQPADRIVCFGSFLTVGGVLAHGLPDLYAGPHGTPARG